MESITEALAAQKTAAENRKGRIEALRSKMAPPFPPKKSEDDDDEEDEGSASPTFEGEVQDKDGQTVVAAGGARTQPRASLAVASQNAPTIPDRQTSEDLTIVAASTTPAAPIGTRFESNDSLVAAVQTIAKGMAPTHGNPSFQTVATIQHRFPYEADITTKPNDIEEMLRDMLSSEAQEALVAGGGWCAPSEIRYDFFNIACQDGAVDLPTMGIRRGGIQFPVSPSLADVYTGSFTNATNPWLWQEIDDEAAASGLGGEITKPCVRVDCPTFDERRLECYGICLTAGNLTDNAYPEATRNHLSLLMSAHYHAMNARFLSTMELLSTEIVSGGFNVPSSQSGTGILADAPAVVAMAAQDYRTKYGMCDNDVLEVIFPRWVKDAMRIDHLRRTGFWQNPLTDAEINRLFTTFRVRPQWVNDWQIRGAGQLGGSNAALSWPSTVKFMLYAAGTFVKGNGMTLDLGVVRDSVLNSTNDFTAAWTEECHLIAKLGHESRIYTIPVCTAGRTGAADIDCNETE
jgi:hypothetical protein